MDATKVTGCLKVLAMVAGEFRTRLRYQRAKECHYNEGYCFHKDLSF